MKGLVFHFLRSRNLMNRVQRELLIEDERVLCRLRLIVFLPRFQNLLEVLWTFHWKLKKHFRLLKRWRLLKTV